MIKQHMQNSKLTKILCCH